MQGIILEGIPGSGKTLLLQAFLRELPELHSGPLWIATEHLTERVLEPFSEKKSDQAVRHIENHLQVLERMAQWESQAPKGKSSGLVCLLERFHLSVFTHISGIKPKKFQEWEERLKTLNFSLIFLRVDPPKILTQSVKDTILRREKCWSNYLFTLGDSQTDIASYFSSEQESFRESYNRSELSKCDLELIPENVDSGLRTLRTLLKHCSEEKE